RAHWLRCRLVQAIEGQPEYTNPPELESLSVVALGGAGPAHHPAPAPAPPLGTSNGRPGQVFQVRRVPVLPRRHDETVKVVLPRHERTGEPEEQEGRGA